MPINPDKPNVAVFKENMALVDRKMGSHVPFKPSAHGVFSSWEVPLEGLEKDLSAEQRKRLQESKERNPVAPTQSVMRPMVQAAGPSKESVTIPLQALKAFKSLLGNFFEIEVVLTPEQAQMLLETLSEMKTPAKIYDAKAIFNLSTQLEKIAGQV